MILRGIVHVQGLCLARRRAPAANPVQAHIKGRVQEGHHVTLPIRLHSRPDGANHVADHEPFVKDNARSGALHDLHQSLCDLANGADCVTASARCRVAANHEDWNFEHSALIEPNLPAAIPNGSGPREAYDLAYYRCLTRPARAPWIVGADSRRVDWHGTYSSYKIPYRGKVAAPVGGSPQARQSTESCMTPTATPCPPPERQPELPRLQPGRSPPAARKPPGRRCRPRA